MAGMNCKTTPNCPDWDRHLEEIERLQKQAEESGNASLAQALTELLVEHKAASWQSSIGQMTQNLQRLS